MILAIIGISTAYLLYRRGLDDPAHDPLDDKLGVVGRVFGHAYYYDEGIAKLVGGPLRAGRQLPRTVSSTPRSSTARSTASVIS